MTDVFERNYRLRERLAFLVCGPLSASVRAQPIDVLITPNEVNDRHGTGPLLKRILAGRDNLLCIRSRDEWGGHDFGRWNIRLSQGPATRGDALANILGVLHGCRIRDVLCVPYKYEELLTALAITDVFQARLCLYLMDDQNVSVSAVPDDLMREVIEKSSLRLATHPELRDAYQRKYGLEFYLLPVLVPSALVLQPGESGTGPPGVSGSGALLGSFWDQSWFDNLCQSLRGSGRQIDWFGNNRSPWLKFPAEKMDSAGIHARGVVPEPRLVAELRQQPFVIVPAGRLSQDEINKGVASLSLPGRIIFAAATSHTPILLVGSRSTCGARFVEHFGIGEVVPYETGALRDAMARISRPEAQRSLRANAARIAAGFSDGGAPEWFAASFRQGTPVDLRFERVFEGYPT